MMTDRQKQLLDFIRAHNAEHGYGPSYDQMRVHMKWKSGGQVHAALSSLRTRGLVTWCKYTRGSVRVIERAPSAYKLHTRPLPEGLEPAPWPTLRRIG